MKRFRLSVHEYLQTLTWEVILRCQTGDHQRAGAVKKLNVNYWEPLFDAGEGRGVEHGRVLWGCIDKVGLILFDEENCVLYFDLLDFVCSFPLLYMSMYLLSLLECHELFCFPLSSLGLSSRWARRICSPKYC
jgi:hypothetical protein